MNAVEIEEAVSELALKTFEAEEFPFSFLEAFGNKSTTLKKLRTGSSNKTDEEIAKRVAIENAKIEKLLCDAKNYRKASEIRSYLKAYQVVKTDNNNNINQVYLEWAYKQANEIDPLINISKRK